jgi:hypothetical protein
MEQEFIIYVVTKNIHDKKSDVVLIYEGVIIVIHDYVI